MPGNCGGGTYNPPIGGCAGTRYGCCPDGVTVRDPYMPGNCGSGTYNPPPPPLGPGGQQWLNLDIPADVREKLYCTEQFKSCLQSIN